MRGKFQILAALRRRKAAIVRVVLPILATVWFSTSASLCFAMVPDAVPDASPPSAHHHGSTGHSPDAHQHEHQTPQRSHETPQTGHGHCPHCPATTPAGDGSSSSHISCSALDDLSDNGAAKATKLDLKHTLSAAHFSSLYASPPNSAAARIPKFADLTYRSVPLNLRHCVLQI
jgi:hypothetical protein